jgi:segregation and condensation protein B
MELISIVEALLFASQEPLGLPQMCAAVKETAKDILQASEGGEEACPPPEWLPPLAETTEEQVRAAIDALIARYEAEKHAFTLAERSNGWRICARGEYAEWCRALYPGKKVQRLSQPALETLAIIAYRQPITKAGVEAVRGVSVDAMVQQLVDRGLVKIEGRADLPGRPLLYGTTEAFLDHFGIKSLDDMPNAAELRRVKLPEPDAGQAAAAEPQAEQLALAPVEPATPGEAEAAPDSNGEPAPAPDADSPPPVKPARSKKRAAKEEPAVSTEPSGGDPAQAEPPPDEG